MISLTKLKVRTLDIAAHLSHYRAQGVLDKWSGEVDKTKHGEVGVVVFEWSKINCVGVEVGQYPVELEGDE